LPCLADHFPEGGWGVVWGEYYVVPSGRLTVVFLRPVEGSVGLERSCGRAVAGG